MEAQDRTVDELLQLDVPEIKEYVDEHEPDLDELIEAEQEGRERQELIDWLEAKKERLEILNDDERAEELLKHVENAYRSASISEDTYNEAKQQTKEMIEDEGDA
ncbi:MAG: hypothetical protein SVU32_08355 [Candidatus Nanohaloarchaea archaeon]|nr:hypothetical protein [Candidatus Nanohaloarchaea archaeon]